MSCEEFDTLIHGYLDGELDLLSTLRVEAHLPECVSCARTHENQRALRSVMSSGKLRSRTLRIASMSPSFNVTVWIRRSLTHSNLGATECRFATETADRAGRCRPIWRWAGWTRVVIG